MPTNANAYCEIEIEGAHVTQLMRRINALELVNFLPSWAFNFGSQGSGDGQFTLARACCADDTYIYTCYNSTTFIHVFNASNHTFAFKFGTNGTGDGQFKGTLSMCLSDGELFISDATRHDVQIFIPSTGSFIRKWGTFGLTPNDIRYPFGMCVFDGEVFLADSEYVKVWDANDGTHLRNIGSPGTGDGQFTLAGDCCLFDGELYVMDTYKFGGVQGARIQVFDPSTGDFIRKFGTPGTGDNEIGYVEKFLVADGLVYVPDWHYTDHYWGHFHIFLPNGELLHKLNFVYGSGDGEGAEHSKGIAVNTTYIFLSDLQNYRFSAYLKGTGTEFHAYRLYPYEDSQSLGTPDGGVAVPSNDALVDPWDEGGVTGRQWTVARIIKDMRDAIEAIVALGVLKNPATSVAYNWTDGSANNLYYVAMGDRTKYGAVSGARYTWTRTEAHMVGTHMFDLDIGEIAECISTLEDAEV